MSSEVLDRQTDRKTDIPSSLEHLATWQAYKAATRSHWERWPQFLAAGYSIVLSQSVENGLAGKMGAFRKSLWTAARFLKYSGRPRLSLPPCDALLFHASDKPSAQPATDLLAERLTRKGFRCAVVSPSAIRVSVAGEDGDGSDGLAHDQWTRSGLGRLRALALLIGSVRATVVLLALLWRRDRQVTSFVLDHLFEVWRLLLASSSLTYAVDRLVNRLSPRLLIVNENRVPLASELLLSPASKGAHKVFFCNELPLVTQEPFLADEVWVWNQTVADSFRRVATDGTAPTFSVVGNAESDLAVAVPLDGEGASEVRRQAERRPVLLFLSQYLSRNRLNLEDLTKEAVEWLYHAARERPDWYFVFKTRPSHHQVTAPWLERFSELENAAISRDEATFAEFLGWDNLAAVASFRSTGLYVAASLGKPALRFLVSSAQPPIPVIDEIATAVHSPGELVDVIAGLDVRGGGSSMAEDKRFPYRGATLNRMESLSLERLGGGQ